MPRNKYSPTRNPAGFLPVVWLTGNTGAGKTTLAYGAQEYFNGVTAVVSPLQRRIVVLDGDEMRASISVAETLSPADRRTHNLRVARLARVLQEQGFLVVVAVIAPFAEVRAEIDGICHPVWVYVKRSLPESADRPYEAPSHPDLVIDDDAQDIPNALAEFVTFLRMTEKPVMATTNA